GAGPDLARAAGLGERRAHHRDARHPARADGGRGARLAPLRRPPRRLRALARPSPPAEARCRLPAGAGVRPRPAAVLGAGLPAAAIVVAGCGSGGGGSSAASGAPAVDVTLVDAGCSPARVKVPAGPVTFHVTNRGAGAVTELEVQSPGSRVLGEVENLADG